MVEDGPNLEKILGPLEAEVMKVVWGGEGSYTVREVLDRLNHRRRPKLAYTTVMTVMSRLAEKEVLRRRPEGRGYVYEAAVQDAAELAVRNVLRDFGEAALAHFVDEVRADPQALRRLERLLEPDR
jgi:predicted transcriptional regulator